MNRIALLSLAATSLVSGVVAQANTVPGLDGALTVVGNLTYWGRRGAAYPNGEVGMSMLNTMCNPGSVNIPWYAPMQPDHPMFGFIICRLKDDRIEQINEWSYCKHAFLSVNVNGTCGTCQNPGTGSLMGVNCSDTYSEWNNASRTYLGPPEEIDPWLGEWDPVGSYFDIGDPAQAGYPAPADGARSLNTNIFDDVDNRVTVDEADLTTAGSDYFYGIQLLHRGESVSNRGDNLAHRGFDPDWDGVEWSFSNNGATQEFGTILSRWPGADITSGSNGGDDGRFFIAVKVTPLGGGDYHYEYAIHNVDNSRAGGSFRVPVDAGATVTNYTFGDIDTDAANDWSAQRVGNEIVFFAPAGNPLEWNTIYNFGFDADFPPGIALASIDEARPGAGAPTVDIQTQVPAGSTFAQAIEFGIGCGGDDCQSSFYEQFTSGAFDLQVTGLKMTYNNGAYDVGPATASYLAPTGFALGLGDDDVQTVNLPFTLPYPGGTTSSLAVCSNGFISAVTDGDDYDPSAQVLLNGAPRWAPLWHDYDPSGTSSIRVSASSSRVTISYTNVPNFAAGGNATFQVQFQSNGDVHYFWQAVLQTGNDYMIGWSPGGGVSDPGNWDISASLAAGLALCDQPVPPLALYADTRPIIGTNFDMVTDNIPSNSIFGILMLSLAEFNPGIDLSIINMPGCELYATIDQADHVLFNFLSLTSPASYTLVMPNIPAISGISFTAQSAVTAPDENPFGMITSNGVRLIAGIN